MLQGKLHSGADAMTARMTLEVATRGGAGCLGRVGEIGEISVGAVGDIAVWDLSGPAFAGVLDDPIEGWLRCGPLNARDTIVHGRTIVLDGNIVSSDLATNLVRHRLASRRFQPR